METKIAQFLSLIFQPLFMPLFTVFLLFNSGTYITYAISEDAQKWIYMIFTVNFILVPSIIFLWLLRKGAIKSLYMNTAEERRLPFVITLVLYIVTFYLLRKLELPELLYLLILGAAFSIVIAFFVTLKWKISIHTMGMGGVAGMVLGLILRLDAQLIHVLAALIFLSGLVGFARLKLGVHTPAQVYTGFVVGSALMCGLIMMA